jgi:hypothetical protein
MQSSTFAPAFSKEAIAAMNERLIVSFALEKSKQEQKELDQGKRLAAEDGAERALQKLNEMSIKADFARLEKLVLGDR